MDKLIEILVNLWLYDIEIITTPWVYFTVFPAILYSIFMFFKWAIILMPILLPLSVITKSQSVSLKSK
jgi:hypothetical protein